MQFQQPRKRDSEATRIRILCAAQTAFSRTGYSHTGIREVAAQAGTSSTLVLRYFGSKAGLFEAALRAAMPVERLTCLPAPDMAAMLSAMLRENDDAARAMMMIAMGSGEPESAAIAARVFTEHSLLPLGAAITAHDAAGHDAAGHDGKVRSLKLSMLTIGYIFFMKHLPIDALAPHEAEAIHAWFNDGLHQLIVPPC